MDLNLLLIFSGVLASAFFSVYFIFFRRIDCGGRKYIISGMLISLYIFVYDFLAVTGNYHICIWLYPLYFSALFAIYPLAYHYLVSAVNDKNKRVIVKIFTYMPLLVFAINAYYYLFLPVDLKLKFVESNILSFNGSWKLFFEYQVINYILYYIEAGLFILIFGKMYFIHKARKQNLNKEGKPYLPQWLFSIIFFLIIYEALYLASMIFTEDFQTSVLLNTISNLLIVTAIGFLGMKHEEILLDIQLQSVKEIRQKKSDRNHFDKEETEKVLSEIKRIIKEKELFRNPAFKLETLAKKIHIPVKQVSMIINEAEGKNFSKFINDFRIDEAKNILSQPGNHSKIKDIFPEVGFYSRSAFNRAFKNCEGITPTEFVKNIG